MDFPIGFFDGAHKNGWFRGGMIPQVKKDHIIKLKMGIGKGTNTLFEILSLLGLLWFVKNRGLMFLEVHGDSKVIIDWDNGYDHM